MTVSSQEWLKRAQAVLVDGGSSASRGPRVFKPYPPYMASGTGARLTDVEGNEYIDWMMAFGALPLGHAHPAVVAAGTEAIATGSHFAASIPVEVELAEMICQLVPAAEKVRFSSTGTEAVMGAIRLARGYTGRRKILKFEGHYHGWSDAVLVTTNPQPLATLGHPHSPVGIVDSSGIPPGAVEDTIIVPWNDIDVFRRVMKNQGHEIACVMTEAVMSNIGVILPQDGYLQEMQTICREYGSLFYLDETCTGFRSAPGGCAELFGLEPDLVTFGKALGMGLPLSAICGSEEIMSGLTWGNVMHFGTFNAARAPCSTALAGLKVLAENNNAGFKKLRTIGVELTTELQSLFKSQNQHDVICQGEGPLLQIFFTDRPSIGDLRAYCQSVDSAKYNRFANLLREEGVYITPSNTLHSASSLAHTSEDVSITVKAFAKALQRLD
jgi:glutamate-1-semialdehyde 2,1-aminomutase